MKTLLTLALLASLAAAPARAAEPSPAVIRAAIERYAPLVYLHPKESFLPTSADRFFGISTPAVWEGHPGRKLKDSGPSRRGDLGHAESYVHAKLYGNHIDLQWWFLYAYNGPGTAYFKYLGMNGRYHPLPDANMEPCGRHEGDWEGMTVRIDYAGKLLGAWVNQHDGGIALRPEQFFKSGRTIVYASRNGHATYVNEDRNYSNTIKAGVVEFRLVNETAKGIAYDTRGRSRLISVHDLRGFDNGFPSPADKVRSYINAGYRGPLPPNQTKAIDNRKLLSTFGVAEPAWMNSTYGRWGFVSKPQAENLKKKLRASLGKVGEEILSKSGGEKVLNMILAKSGMGGECLEEAGPAAPWSKPSWLGKDSD
jgi:hypothetical protein